MHPPGCSPSLGPFHSFTLPTSVFVSKVCSELLLSSFALVPSLLPHPLHFQPLDLALPVPLVSSLVLLSGLRLLVVGSFCLCPLPLPLVCSCAPSPPHCLSLPAGWLVLDVVSLFLPRTLLPLPDRSSGPLWPDQSYSSVSQLTPSPTYPLCCLSLPSSHASPLLSSWTLTSTQIFFLYPVCPPHYYLPPPVSPSTLLIFLLQSWRGLVS